MPLPPPLIDAQLDGVAPDRRGKVRDIFDLGDSLVLVATDRISAFDYVLGSGIPDKGKVLTQLSAFWFDRTQSIVANHVLTLDVSQYPEPMRRHADSTKSMSPSVRCACIAATAHSQMIQDGPRSH